MDDFTESAQPTLRSVRGYEVLREIGRGSMGIVQLARQPELDRLVALKELNRVHADTPGLAERFVRESRLAASLSHANIVTIFESFRENETPYIAMEYLPRGSLRPWVGELTLAQLVGVLEGLLAGLAAAESAGIVHRDLKPENIMVAADGRVKITDFGIAKATEAAGTGSFLTATGATVGTPAYMAPEQALAREVGPWTDLYSLGVIAYELLVGRVPFADSRSSTEILMRHVSEPIAPPIEARPDVNPALSDWVGRLLVKEPAERTVGSSHAWDELEEIVLDVLGPRWRRDALLPARPGGSDLAATPRGAPAQPEAESRLLSYQRTPESTGATAPGARAAPPAKAAGTASHGERADQGQASSALTQEPPRDAATGAQRRARRLLLVSVLIGGLAAAAGFALAPSHGGAGTPAALAARASGAFGEVSLPSSWRRATRAPATPGLRLGNALALASPTPGGKLVVGSGTTSDGTLLPASLLSDLRGRPRQEVVRLGAGDFYRYRGLTPAGSTVSETVYAQPTSTGTLLAACLLPRGNPSGVEADCERILGSLRLVSARALALGPSATYAAHLSGAILRLNGIRASAGPSLAHATTATRQAAAAERLAAAHGQAAASVRRERPGPAERAANAALASALTELADGYGTIADAARGGDRSRFNAGRKTVRSGTAALEAAFARLRALGYRPGG